MTGSWYVFKSTILARGLLNNIVRSSVKYLHKWSTVLLYEHLYSLETVTYTSRYLISLHQVNSRPLIVAMLLNLTLN